MTENDTDRLVARVVEHVDQGHDICVEPARGATYASGEPTVYAYGTYKKGSVLEGQQMRCYIGPLPDGVTPKFFAETCKNLRGIEVEVLEDTQWHENFNTVDHLPDGPDL